MLGSDVTRPEDYYRRGVRELRRAALLHRLRPSLHAWPAAADPGTEYVRCRGCAATRAAHHTECPFCSLDTIDTPTVMWKSPTGGEDVMVFEPRHPVTAGHKLVVPVRHVTTAAEDPALTGAVMEVAAMVAEGCESSNIITSAGIPATQRVLHLHAHVVPRRVGDHLQLPWSPPTQRKGE